ncbi:MAG: tripartite-type tricarboxylate transporter receptor subunit TctC [Paracoccaceae bacterium]|jgi:tripartite-type tricarboxylate transporter receptor subunit TctC
MLTRHITSAALAAALVFGGATAANAETAAEFYKGKTLKIVFGFGVGGTYGKYSQILAQYLAPYTGAEKVITQSMPGAGGIKSANYMYNVAKADGLTLFMPPDTIVISELLRPKAVKYKSNDFQWLGTAVQSNSVIALRGDAGIQKVSDLKSKQVIMGSTGKGSQTFLMPSLVNGVLGTKFKIVSGYKGSRKTQLAMEQNEVQGVSLTWLSWKSAKEKWFKDGFAKAVIQIGVEKEEDLPNVPMLADLVTGENRQIVNFMATMGPLGRGLVVPKGTPKDRVDFLRAAFAKTVADPNFIVNAEKRKLRVKAATGAQLQKIVNDSLKVSNETVKRAQVLIFGKSS